MLYDGWVCKEFNSGQPLVLTENPFRPEKQVNDILPLLAKDRFFYTLRDSQHHFLAHAVLGSKAASRAKLRERALRPQLAESHPSLTCQKFSFANSFIPFHDLRYI